MDESAEAVKSARGPSCTLPPSVVGPLLNVQEISAADYDQVRKRNEPHVLLDVRVPEQVDICKLPGSVNIPLKALVQRIDEVQELSNGSKPVYVICRRGVFSVAATQLLSEKLAAYPKIKSVTNIKGGLEAWRGKVDPSFPKY
jgi:rhodanese-related sulfurtransferase